MGFFLAVMAIFLAAHGRRGMRYRHLHPQPGEGEDPAPIDRLFWCVMLTLVPLAMIFAKAPLNTMKTTVIVTAIPFAIITLIKVYGLLKWLREDYGDVPAHQIGEQSPQWKPAASPLPEPP
jgi:BCCT family betaine/carnitine transporter